MVQIELDQSFRFIAFMLLAGQPCLARKPILKCRTIFALPCCLAAESVLKLLHVASQSKSGLGASIALSSDPAAKVYPINVPSLSGMSCARPREHFCFALTSEIQDHLVYCVFL